MTREELQRVEEDLGVPGSDIRLTKPAIDMQVIALERFELEAITKKYFYALHQIAEVECKEDGKWCHEDDSIECEHNLARKVLDL